MAGRSCDADDTTRVASGPASSGGAAVGPRTTEGTTAGRSSPCGREPCVWRRRPLLSRCPPRRPRVGMIRIASVLWSGLVGGAETFTAELCRAMRDLGVDAGVVFVTRGGPLSSRLDADGIPHASLELGRGREVLRHPRMLASAVQALGPDGVLLMGGGYLAAALRLGGYRARVVAIMHGATIELGPMTLRDRIVRPLDRAMGTWATDVDVAVSDFALSQIQLHRRRGRLIRIYNGVDLGIYRGSWKSTDVNGATVAY